MNFIKAPVKGMCDVMPQEMVIRNYVLNIIKSTYKKYGFMEIETPVMEHIENLKSDQGGENESLIFEVLKRGRDLEKAIEEGKNNFSDNGLRYDLTVPLSRYYSNYKELLPSPFKALQIGSVWRADKPQKGRYRQFMQCDIDILGDDSNLAEIELISATSEAITKIFECISIKNFTIHINDRRVLFAIAKSAGFKEEDIPSVLITLDKFDKIGFDGVKTELVTNGFDENVVDKYLGFYNSEDKNDIKAFCKNIGEEFLSNETIEAIFETIESTKTMTTDNVNIVFDPTLVRGMGYYTGTIFEVTVDDYNFSIGGGGRYDKMIGKFTKTDVAACGFSIGFSRIITILNDFADKMVMKNENTKNVAILIEKNVSNDKKIKAFEEAKALRKEGMNVTVQPMKKNLKLQIEKLEQNGYTEFTKVFKD